ncbi:Maf family nucleotide pyrophosphatase [Defluviimonas sp. WL0050]|uniref:Nucleoside triphosphate pyrophosphatase n=1 Tax=Albidovulum litorale TaxID=2984134 RepID=A0ABT2ZN35_9RHOB|nr:Maf family nucleotide pyrophosphatase [Defluviimonas sp. WL0050]MCV2872556.1 Maf family nucleotide pyrophosphatase [Defluviimonas sp. WL0050]
MIPSPDRRLILASGSEIRAQLLRNAGLAPEIMPARVDEEAIRAALEAEDASPSDLADALAEMKARKISDKHPDGLVLGCDQILDCRRQVFSKPTDLTDARNQIRTLRGQTHRLLSAAVIYEAGKPLWRHVGEVRLTMRDVSDAYIDDYVARNWESIRHTVGCYKLEEEGVRLFSRIDGDYFNVLGLPLIELLTWLGIRGDIAT